ncbi:MAG: helix-turn-helix domain-containing protein [Actinobacteria bacterium]|nr:helix-turn-helix domain-containing protein [Actinomycetota bacterium]
MRKWKTLDEFKSELLKDEDFRARFEDHVHAFAIAREILAARRAAGMSQEELARAIGTSQSRVSKWERGEEMPRIEALYRIADATGTTVEVAFVSGSAAKDSHKLSKRGNRVRIASI